MAAKVQIKDEKYMPYGGIYFVIREFLRLMAPVIDGYLGLRSTLIGYQYSEISLATSAVVATGLRTSTVCMT